MPIRKYNPTSPGQRFQTVQTFDEITTNVPHKPLVERRGHTLFVNPGSAGPRRFKLPITLAWLDIDQGKIDAHIVTLAQ